MHQRVAMTTVATNDMTHFDKHERIHSCAALEAD